MLDLLASFYNSKFICNHKSNIRIFFINVVKYVIFCIIMYRMWFVFVEDSHNITHC